MTRVFSLSRQFPDDGGCGYTALVAEATFPASLTCSVHGASLSILQLPPRPLPCEALTRRSSPGTRPSLAQGQPTARRRDRAGTSPELQVLFPELPSQTLQVRGKAGSPLCSPKQKPRRTSQDHAPHPPQQRRNETLRLQQAAQTRQAQLTSKKDPRPDSGNDPDLNAAALSSARGPARSLQADGRG